MSSIQHIDLDAEITSFRTAAEVPQLPYWKADLYIKAAKLQITKGDFNGARESLQSAYDNDSRTKTACKIARLELKIDPSQLSEKFWTASNQEEEERRRNKKDGQRARHLLPLHVSKLCYLAKTFLKAAMQTEAKKLLEEASKCLGGKTWEYCGDLQLLASLQKKAGMNQEATVSLEKLFHKFPKEDLAPEAIAANWIWIASKYVSLNNERAKELIQRALAEGPSLKNLCDSLPVQVALGLQDEASANLEKILHHIPQLPALYQKIDGWCDLAKIVNTFDPIKAAQIVKRANEELRAIEQNPNLDKHGKKEIKQLTTKVQEWSTLCGTNK